MSKANLALLSIIALLAFGFDASAESKKCPKGYVYDEESGKCVVKRGSG